jgi:tRNA(fMet)-specific endonuclease VapC
MRYLLDTNIVIAISKNNPELSEWLHRCPASAIVLSAIVLAELEYGIAKSAKPEHNRRVFEAITKNFAVLGFEASASGHYGRMRANLERRGQLIGPYDMMIAAQALALDLTMVTDNVDEFSRVEGLRIENWLRQSPG